MRYRRPRPRWRKATEIQVGDMLCPIEAQAFEVLAVETVGEDVRVHGSFQPSGEIKVSATYWKIIPPYPPFEPLPTIFACLKYKVDDGEILLTSKRSIFEAYRNAFMKSLI